MPTPETFSQDCVDLAKASEGCKLTAYDDAHPDRILAPGDVIEGILTIGWGHTGPDVYIGLVWTQQQTDNVLLADLDRECRYMLALVKVPLTQGQIDALTDFTFNDGSKRLQHSNMLAILNGGNYKEVPYQLYHVDADGTPHGWIFSGGVPLAGLIRRRQGEIALWNKTAA